MICAKNDQGLDISVQLNIKSIFLIIGLCMIGKAEHHLKVSHIVCDLSVMRNLNDIIFLIRSEDLGYIRSSRIM